jgi:hypothetical protein
LNQAPQAKPVRDNDPYYSTAGAFLDKIFQHQLTLPPVRPEALTNFAMGIANLQGGLWAELRKDTRKYEDVVYSLVPAHVQSPRRVKILMNNFATNVRVLESRRMDWTSRAAQVAVLTVLETEFPSVARDLLAQPLLLEALVNDELPRSDELQQFAERYSPKTDRSDGNAAGPLLTSDDQANTATARRKLNEQLDGYLSKINAAGILLPTPDLIYLQTAGHAEGLTDLDLANVLDFAGDTKPTQLLERFAGASAGDRLAAVRFLATQANTTFGPSRANIIESACRLAETLSCDELRPIAGYVASTFLGEVPKGRWRPEATPGAILLGLLDTEINDPLWQMGNWADPDELARAGFLQRIIPVLPSLDEARAEGVHELLGRHTPLIRIRCTKH